MIQEDKELLLKDISGRLPYGLVLDVDTTDWKAPQGHIQLKIEGMGILFKDMSLIVNGCYYGDNYKPYLRPMPSMTEEERKELNNRLPYKCEIEIDELGDLYFDSKEPLFFDTELISDIIDWLNAHHFDYRGLIEKGLAIAVDEENNPYKE
jgi:hypothetical protein